MSSISMTELALEGGELLPQREALGGIFSPNLSHVTATATAVALNAASIFANAQAWAGNSVVVVQS